MLLKNNKTKIVGLSLIGGLVIAIISFGAVFAMRTQQNQSSVTDSSLASKTPLSELAGSKENPYEVSLTKDQTEPIDLLINIGDYVQFTSKDGSEHQIIQGKPTADHGHDEYADAVHGEDHGATDSPLDSGVFKSDEAYLLQFKNVGKYEFHDNFNHDYAITVIVYDKNKKLEDTKIE